MTRPLAITGGAGPREAAAIVAVLRRLLEEEAAAAAKPRRRPEPNNWVRVGRAERLEPPAYRTGTSRYADPLDG